MKAWLPLSLGLLLGQTPEVTPAVPPDADVQDPAAIELREAWERALLNADATDEGQDFTDGNIQMPALEVGGRNDTTRSVPAADAAAAGQATGLGTTGVGGAGTAGITDAAGATEGTQAAQAPASTGNPQQDVAQLRAQVQALQAQLEASTANTGLVQEQLTGIQDRAGEMERLRQERLSELERARTWLVAADQALAVGELAIGDALTEADTALAQVLDSATATGSGQTVILIEDARGFIAQALEATGRRDTYQARGHLLAADWQLRQARRENLDTPGATVVTQ
ncbi:hypothetical protein [Hyalangium gracile]|uniref:hypothetical protein n=1 Tax=Hyalangium gracile TaxID=394092 RepID=UPI001CCAEF2A|nr:hypothetical protein [Hyalangium gracile]